jgi:hypothetical protein
MSEQPKRPVMGTPGYYPDDAQERRIGRIEFPRTTPGERVADAIRLSRFVTRVAVIGQRRR